MREEPSTLKDTAGHSSAGGTCGLSYRMHPRLVYRKRRLRKGEPRSLCRRTGSTSRILCTSSTRSMAHRRWNGICTDGAAGLNRPPARMVTPVENTMVPTTRLR